MATTPSVCRLPQHPASSNSATETLNPLAQLVFERTHYLPPVFERLSVFDADFESKLGHRHKLTARAGDSVRPPFCPLHRLFLAYFFQTE